MSPLDISSLPQMHAAYVPQYRGNLDLKTRIKISFHTSGIAIPSMDEISIGWIEGYNFPSANENHAATLGNSEVDAQDEDAYTDGRVESDQDMAMGIEHENKH